MLIRYIILLPPNGSGTTWIPDRPASPSPACGHRDESLHPYDRAGPGLLCCGRRWGAKGPLLGYYVYDFRQDTSRADRSPHDPRMIRDEIPALPHPPWREPEGGYTVTVPMLPGCVTYGETIDDAIAMAREAIELYIEDLQEKGEEIPTEEGLLEYTLTIEAHA